VFATRPKDRVTVGLTGMQVANKKQKDIAASDAEMKKKREAAQAGNQENQAPEDSGPTDLLAAEEDEDVIF
jgi:V-type H+-transporting ATPase subunit D